MSTLAPLTSDRAAEFALGALEGEPLPAVPALWADIIAALRNRPGIDATSDAYLLGREWVARTRNGRALVDIEELVAADDLVPAMLFLQAFANAADLRLQAWRARGGQGES